MMEAPTVTAVVLAYGPEPLIGDCVEALLASRDVSCDVVLVDNGGTDGRIEHFRTRERVTVVGHGTNLGFAGGCNLGARLATGDYLALVNGDAVIDPDCLSRLVAVARRPEVGLAGASIRLYDQPDLLNSGGNTIHFLGFSWCGHINEPAADFPAEMSVTTAMASTVVLPLTRWREIGGFAEPYFAYHEDVDLCFGLRLRGYDIVWVRDAITRHRYEFSRNTFKLGIVDRNRLAFVMTNFEARTLWLLAPAFVVMEAGVLGLSVIQGWFGPKVKGWWWLWRHRAWIRQHRRERQAVRVVHDRDLVPLLSTSLGFQPYPLPAPAKVVDRLLGLWWRLVRRWV